MKKHHWAILLASLYLVVYTILVETSANLLLLSALFTASLFIVIWVVVSILKAPYHGRTLKTGEEYGYADKSTETLGWI
ncbi:MAG TPA: hypothetical protein VLC98_08610 [Phnomibacter sp.]|nr:hypothetical protein [Phnomibacter sp.]